MKFRQRFDYISILLTLLIIAVGIAIGFITFTTSSSSFLPAWITALLIGTILLVITSIPKSVEITPNALEIHCLLELTYIPLSNIKDVKQVRLKSIMLVPMLGVFGFFGYYGYFLSLNKMRIFRVYARNWRRLIQIDTLDNKRYLISVPELQKFLTELDKQRNLLQSK